MGAPHRPAVTRAFRFPISRPRSWMVFVPTRFAAGRCLTWPRARRLSKQTEGSYRRMCRQDEPSMTPRPRPLALVPSGREAAAGPKFSGTNRRHAKTLSGAQSRTTVSAMWVRNVLLEVAAATSVQASDVARARATPARRRSPLVAIAAGSPTGACRGHSATMGPHRLARPRPPPVNPARRCRTRIPAWTGCTVGRMARTPGFAARFPPKERAATPWEFAIRCSTIATTRRRSVCPTSRRGAIAAPPAPPASPTPLAIRPAGAWPRHRPASRVTTSTGLAVWVRSCATQAAAPFRSTPRSVGRGRRASKPSTLP